MARKDEAIPSARVKVFLVPPQGSGRDPLPIGLVEDTSLDQRFRSENLPALGDPHPVDNVVNMEDGSVSFNAVYRDNPDVLRVIAPRIAEFTSYERFDMLVLDPKDNKPIKMAKGLIPENLRFNAQAGRAPRLQYSGICLVVLSGEEVSQALAA